MKRQDGFALELLIRGESLIGEPLFSALEANTAARLFPGRRSFKERLVGKAIHTLEGLAP